MAKFDTKKENRLSGLIGNVVISGNTVRARPRYKKNHKWTDSQKNHRLRFAGVIALYQQLKNSIVKPIWSNAATEGLTAYNLFIKENIAAFDSDGKLKDLMKLKMAIGSLPQPFNFKLKQFQLDPSKLKLSWENDVNMSRERGQDRLIVVFCKDGRFTAPVTTEYIRLDKVAYIQVAKCFEDGGFVYLFFGNKRAYAFSESWVGELCVGVLMFIDLNILFDICSVV